MKLKSIILLALFSLILQGNATAEVYKHVNKYGAVTYRNKPAANDQGARETPSAELSRSDIAKAKVELFVTSWCPYCEQAETFFRKRGIPFTVYDIEKDSRAARRKSKLTENRGVPFALINGYKVNGFSEETYLYALTARK